MLQVYVDLDITTSMSHKRYITQHHNQGGIHSHSYAVKLL